jgi:Ca-activated chloride channel family protein
MDERALGTLKTMPVPPPREGARAAAIRVAVAAFDAAAEKNAAEPKDGVVPPRPTHASIPRRPLMRVIAHPQTAALAASLVALVVAAPFAFRALREGALPLPDAAQTDFAPADRKDLASSKTRGIDLDERLAEPGKAKTVPASGALAPADAKPDSSIDAPKQEMAVPRRDEGLTNLPALVAAVPPSPVPAERDGLGMLGGNAGQTAGPQSYGAEGGGEQVADLEKEHRDHFEAKDDNPVKQVAAEPVSTFSLDVDTASYSFVRRALNAGMLPPKAAVRVEEMINYFPYAYPAPETADVPFKPTVTVVPSPWTPGNKLVHVAIKGYDLKRAERPKANLVLLVDVSGSMEPDDRLPLVKNAFRLLIDQLRPDDTVGIVTYASGSGIALEPTKISDKAKILRALDALGAGGSTAGAAGITDAYKLAEAGFDKEAINRVILATDGDFNVGITDESELKSFIERERASGIFLSILGVGEGNYNDGLMQTLAQNGNGTAAYVDTLNEARKVLVDEASSALFPIAKDVKVQVEWNPREVAEYRLVGYETRALRREDFNNDKVDAGDVGSGHTVTAIYEITPAGGKTLVDDLRYAPRSSDAKEQPAAEPASHELGFLKLRYKRPAEQQSRLIEMPIGAGEAKDSLDQASDDVRFSIAVAGFGQLLRGVPFSGTTSYADVLTLAQGARGEDAFGYRSEFLNLVRLAQSARP